MELVLARGPASPAELAALDTLLPAALEDARTSSAQARLAHPRRHLLLPGLHALVRAAGFVSENGLAELCRRLEVPFAEAYGVASFYALLPLSARPASVAHVCVDLACAARGEALCAALAGGLGPDVTKATGDAGPPAATGWAESACLGRCEAAPAVLVTRAGAAPSAASIAPATVEATLAALTGEETVAPVPPRVVSLGPALLTARIGRVDPESLDAYRAAGGYTALRRAVALHPEGVIAELARAGLSGRGGAGFPTAAKWEAVAKAPKRPHYLICNADESEPGTFKDRVLMEGDPFALLEAMTIAGYAVGASEGYLYLRGEYPLAERRLASAIAQARRRGLLGQDVAGFGFAFDVRLFRGAGAYICGEETALFNSLEGFRGEPRNKPPFPTEAGLFGCPTAVNNVETLANVVPILTEGADAFAAVGTEASRGTRLFSLSGAIPRPGLYEVPQGTPLRELLAAAGASEDRMPAAVLLGGAAGTFAAPADYAVPLSTEGTRSTGLSLGSGVVMAFASLAEVRRACSRIARFFVDESCGQCVPCRVGTLRQEELLARLARGIPLGSEQAELSLLNDLGRVMRDASICGLGQTAPSAISSALSRFGVGILTGNGHTEIPRTQEEQ